MWHALYDCFQNFANANALLRAGKDGIAGIDPDNFLDLFAHAFRFRGRKIDAQILEELESRLLLADVGVEATEHILSNLQKRAANYKD